MTAAITKPDIERLRAEIKRQHDELLAVLGHVRDLRLGGPDERWSRGWTRADLIAEVERLRSP